MGYGYSTISPHTTDHFWPNPLNGDSIPLIWLDYAHLKSFPSRSEKIRQFNNDTVEKGPWGRALTNHGLCNVTETVSIHCTPLLDCWYCESHDATGCYEATNFKSKRVRF